jgi:hypothetical protein
MKLFKIDAGTPLNKQILLYWEASKHFEDGKIFYSASDNKLHHCLFDGEQLNCEPSHWCYLPEVD